MSTSLSKLTRLQTTDYRLQTTDWNRDCGSSRRSSLPSTPAAQWPDGADPAGQRAGIEAAKGKGIYRGRPVTFDRARIVSLRKEGMGATEIAKVVGCKRETSTRR